MKFAALAAIGACMLAALLVSNGNPLVTMSPLIVLGLLVAIWRLPLRASVIGLFVAVLCLDNPFEIPFAGMWVSPLTPLMQLLYDNLRKVTGIGALRFPLIFLLMAALLALAVYRRAKGSRLDLGVVETPRCLKVSLVVSFVAVMFLEAMGIARGGDGQQSLWQIQHLLFIPVVAGFWQFGIRGPKDHRALAAVVLVSACFKVFLGAYFLYVIARPEGMEPPYVTQHTDTVLFVVAIMIAFALWMEQPSLKHALLCVVVIPIVLFGIVINDRRLAYVSLGACLVTVFLISPWNPAKRFLARALLMSLPLLVPYCVVGWSSHSAVFKPVQVIRSVVANDADTDEQADSSTEFRHMENFNLVATWAPNPVFGSGFGHEYNEVIPLPDISKFFPAYRYVPHNSILWLWGIGGVVGFSAMWMFMVIGVLSDRPRLSARAPRPRIEPRRWCACASWSASSTRPSATWGPRAGSPSSRWPRPSFWVGSWQSPRGHGRPAPCRSGAGRFPSACAWRRAHTREP